MFDRPARWPCDEKWKPTRRREPVGDPRREVMEEERSTTMNRNPSWLSPEDDRLRVEVHHVWKPRPLGRSILWTPIGPARRDEPTGSYEVFVEQRTLETMYGHVWGADPNDA